MSINSSYTHIFWLVIFERYFFFSESISLNAGTSLPITVVDSLRLGQWCGHDFKCAQLTRNLTLSNPSAYEAGANNQFSAKSKLFLTTCMLNFIWGHFQRGPRTMPEVLLLPDQKCQSAEGLQRVRNSTGNYCLLYLHGKLHFWALSMGLYAS